MTARTGITLAILQAVWWIITPEYWPLWARLLPSALVILTALVLIYVLIITQARGRKIVSKTEARRIPGRSNTPPCVRQTGVLMGKPLVEQVADARFNQAGQWIHTLENHISLFFMIGLHTLDHPISGIATELKDLFTKAEGWLEKHAEAHAKKFAPVLGPEAPAAEAAEDETAAAPPNSAPITEATPAPEATV